MGPNRRGGAANRAAPRGGGRGGGGGGRGGGRGGGGRGRGGGPQPPPGGLSRQAAAQQQTAAAAGRVGGAPGHGGLEEVLLHADIRRRLEQLLLTPCIAPNQPTDRSPANKTGISSDDSSEPSSSEDTTVQPSGALSLFFADVETKAEAELVRMGLDQTLAAQAICETKRPVSAWSASQMRFNELKRGRVGQALDWCILRLPESQLPAFLRQPKQRRPDSGRQQEASEGPLVGAPSAKAAVSPQEEGEDPVVLGLLAGGLSTVGTPEAARVALAAAGGNISACLRSLSMQHLHRQARPNGVDAAEAQALRSDEILALSAIYGRDWGPGCSSLGLPVALSSLDSVTSQPVEGLLQVELDGTKAKASLYPLAPPAALWFAPRGDPGAQGDSMAMAREAAMGAALVGGLATQAGQMTGEPMLHGLASWLEEEGAAVCMAALARLEERLAEQSSAPTDNEEEDDAEEEGEEEESESEQEAGCAGSGGVGRSLAQMTLREVEAIPRKMTMEGGRYVDVHQQLERDKEQWRRERKALKEDRRKARIAKEKAKEAQRARMESGNTRSQQVSGELRGLAEAEMDALAKLESAAEAEREAQIARAERAWEAQTASRIPQANEHLVSKLKAWQESKDPKVVSMRSQRARLPAWGFKRAVVDAVKANQVVVIAGETGCGKTTQVPQFILDDAIASGSGGSVRLVCTQPRRISATSVAARVASERNEEVGQTVGYQIRLESRSGPETRVLFCTLGILLRRLIDDPTLVGSSHIVVDEVHERSLDSDFLLVLLRKLLQRKPSLKIVLMSATLNADAFASYFGGAAVLTIPGFTHPVKEVYLEDIVAITGYSLPQGSDLKRQAKRTPEEAAELKAIEALRGHGYKEETIRTLKQADPEKINYELMALLVGWICSQGEPGAVLIFMPGLMEITKLHTALMASPTVRSATGDGAYLIGLHSALNSAQQGAVFKVPPKGNRKVVIATNIAETSITIEDCIFVIDTGRVKENSYSPGTHMSCLLEQWTSRASARQRRGRAGRVAPGTCFRLYTRWTHDKGFADHQEPEMLRVPIESLCLQIKMLNFPGGLEGFLSSALQPPKAEAVTAAIGALKSVGALNHFESLTSLGGHLAMLPVDVRVGKMLLLASVMGCLDPVLTIAAAMASNSPFVAPLDKRDEADLAKRSFAEWSSDHLAVLRAYEGWISARSAGKAAERAFCRDSFVSGRALEGMADLRQQFRSLLTEAGLLSSGGSASASGGGRRRGQGRGPGARGGGRRAAEGGGGGDNSQRSSRGRGGGISSGWEEANSHSGNVKLVLAVVSAGLYPNLVRVEAPMGKAPKGAPLRLMAKGVTGRGEAVQFHPCSINFNSTKLPTKWLVYLEKVKTSAVYLRDASPATPYSLMLFGGELQVHHTSATVSVDQWAKFSCQPRAAALLRLLRENFETLLARKLDSPAMDVWADGRPVIEAIVQLLDSEKPARP